MKVSEGRPQRDTDGVETETGAETESVFIIYRDRDGEREMKGVFHLIECKAYDKAEAITRSSASGEKG